MEPFHTVNTPFTASYMPACDIEYRICSALELALLAAAGTAACWKISYIKSINFEHT